MKRIPVLAAAALALAMASGAHELKDVSLIAAGGQAHLKLAFSPGPGEGDYPLYFQKADAEKGTLTLSFLDAETAYPLGRHTLDANAPEVEEIILKKITSPSGKNFLGIELKLRDAPMGDAPIQGAPKGVLKVMFGKAAGKYSWSLAKATQAGDAYLSAKAEPPPGGAKAMAASAKSPDGEPASPPVPGEPAIPGREDAPAAVGEEPAAKPSRLVEVKLLVTAAQEDLLLVFDPPSPPNHTPRRDPKEPAWMEIALDGAASGLAKKEYPLPRSTVYKRFKIAGKPGRLVLKVLLAEGETPQVLPQENGLALSALGKGDAAPAFKWSSLKPAGLESENVADTPDPVPSAHAEGEAIEARRGAGSGKGKGLSSSRIFSLGAGGKDMVLTRDSASLKTQAGAAGKLIRKIQVGEKVERIDAKGGNLRVVAGSDTGWIKATDAVYQDELTQAQEAAIQAKIAAKLSKEEQAKARQAAAEARAAEKARKAEEAAAEAERKLAEKQAAKEAKLAAKAEALKLQEAAAATRVGAATAGGPADGQPGQAQAAAGAPKLGLADNPELANKLAQEKLAAEEEKKRIEPEENRVSYNSFGRRDPFIPVEQGASDNGIDIDQMKVVGIIWQSSQPMAVLEHNREAGVSFTVKEGDPVHNGRVARISADAVTFDISEYGISRSYSLRLVSSSTKEGAKK